MKKDIFIILFVVELFTALIMTAWMFSDFGAVIYIIASAVFAVVLYPFFKKLKNETDEDKKKKIRCKILLVLIAPVAIALAVIVILVTNLIIYYS